MKIESQPPTTVSQQLTADSERRWIAVVFITYLLLALFKIRGFLPEGRFWAEEGMYFYHDISRIGPVRGIFYVFNGHIEIVTNLVVSSATMVPLRIAPLITSLLSVFAQAIPVAFLLARRERLNLSVAQVTTVALLTVALPQSTEVWANSINLHFHFAFLASIILLQTAPASGRDWASRAMLFVAGLSGIPANFLLPLYIHRAVTRRSSEASVQAGIICFTAALQLVLLVSFPSHAADRLEPISIWLIGPVAVSQSILGPLFGAQIPSSTYSFLAIHNSPLPKQLLVTVLCFLPFVAMYYHAVKTKSETFKTLIRQYAIFVSLGVLLAFGGKVGMVSIHGSGRYLFVPNCLLLIYVVSNIRNSRLAKIVLLLIAIKSVPAYYRQHQTGPNWKVEYESFEREKKSKINIWPAGWSMDVEPRS